MIVRSALVSLLLVFGISGQVIGQNAPKGIEGAWYGTLDVGSAMLPLIVTVTRSEAGIYSGKLESPAQGATVPLDSVSLRGDDVALVNKAAGLAYGGVLNKDHTEIVGTFNQGGQAIPLTLSRAKPAAAAQAVPAPTPDYSAPADAPYTAEEVLVKTPGGFTLAGTLTLPEGASRTTPVGAVVSITGSGQEDCDSGLGLPGYRPFRQIADALARSGIAMLRMDDRETGGSGGTFKGSTSEDFGEDARAALAPMVAAKEPTLRAIVLLAGVAEPARSALHFQMKNNLEHEANLTPAEKEARIVGIPAAIDRMMAADPWMKFFLTYDPAATMRRVKTPVLILTGSNDKQAAPEQVALEAAAFKCGGNKDVTARVIPGVNHLFAEDPDGFPGNYAKLPPPIVMRADVVQIVTDWMVKHLR